MPSLVVIVLLVKKLLREGYGRGASSDPFPLVLRSPENLIGNKVNRFSFMVEFFTLNLAPIY